MGNSQECCGRRKDSKPLAFSGTELRQLDRTFAEIKGKDGSSSRSSYLTGEGFKAHFVENPDFGAKLFRWCLTASGGKELDLESYRVMAESLLREGGELGESNPWCAFEKFELFFFVSAEITEVSADKLKKLKVSYLQVLNFFLEVLRTFNIARQSERKDLEQAARIAADGIFTTSAGSIPYSTFVREVGSRYRRINKVIRIYLSFKLLHASGKASLVVPAFDKPSVVLLNKELLKLLALAHEPFSQTLKLQQLFTSTGTSSFDGLLAVLDSFKGPTLFILKHLDPMDGNTYLLGGLMTAPWTPQTEGEEFRGDDNAIVFGLAPRFKVYPSIKGDLSVTRWGEKIAGQGLGFGGRLGKRLWISSNLEKGCSIGTEDGSFEPGYLLEPHISQLQIETLEVWGLAVEAGSPLNQATSPMMMQTSTAGRPSSARPSTQPGQEREWAKGKNMDEVLAKLSVQLGANDSRLSASRGELSAQTSVQESGDGVRLSKKLKDIKFRGDIRRIFERHDPGYTGFVNTVSIPRIIDDLKREEDIITQVDLNVLETRVKGIGAGKDSIFVQNFVEAIEASRRF